jgi:hypothetical protein
MLPEQSVVKPAPRQGVLPPADVQAAFDAARAQLRRPAQGWEPPPVVYGPGFEA